MGSIPLIIAIAVCILMSAYFSATETAFSSLNRTRLLSLKDGGSKKAALALKQADDYDRLLSTILIGNNIVNIASASLATIVFVNYFGDMGVTLSTVIMTILVLIFGEISPKSLAKESPERFAMFSAPILKVFLQILRPVNFLFTQWKKLLTLVFKPGQKQGLTEKELLTIVDEAEKDGDIEKEQTALIRSAIEFNDIDVTEVLTPRVEMVTVFLDDSRDEVIKTFKKSGYSRLPVLRESKDDIVGIINYKDFFSKPNATVRELVKPVIYVPETVGISNVLRQLQNTKNHLAVVTDEYGGTVGIVTLEDILEQLVGDIWDEHDKVVNKINPLPDGSISISCALSADKLFEMLSIDAQPDFNTVGGWVMENLGKIPEPGDSFEFEGLNIKVTKTLRKKPCEINVKSKYYTPA